MKIAIVFQKFTNNIDSHFFHEMLSHAEKHVVRVAQAVIAAAQTEKSGRFKPR
jgi:hypothetical protein